MIQILLHVTSAIWDSMLFLRTNSSVRILQLNGTVKREHFISLFISISNPLYGVALQEKKGKHLASLINIRR